MQMNMLTFMQLKFSSEKIRLGDYNGLARVGSIIQQQSSSKIVFTYK